MEFSIPRSRDVLSASSVSTNSFLVSEALGFNGTDEKAIPGEVFWRSILLFIFRESIFLVESHRFFDILFLFLSEKVANTIGVCYNGNINYPEEGKPLYK